MKLRLQNYKQNLANEIGENNANPEYLGWHYLY